MCVSGLVYFRRRAENDGLVHGAAKPQEHVHDVRSYIAEQPRSVTILVNMSLSLRHIVIHHPWCMNPTIILMNEMRQSSHLRPLYAFIGVWSVVLTWLVTTRVTGPTVLIWYLRSLTPSVPRLWFNVTRCI
jgi:hypothetical protein